MRMSLFVAVAFVALAGPAIADHHGEGDMDAAMKKWMELATPGEAHKRLEVFVGTWTCTSKMWMQGPEGPVEEGKAKATYTTEFGGKFLIERFEGEAMGEMPGFIGLMHLGYDNYRKQYIGTWMDSMSTAIATMSGAWHEKDKSLIMYGTMDDAMTGELGKHIRYVTRLESPDRHTFTLFDLSGGESYKSLEIACTRAKK